MTSQQPAHTDSRHSVRNEVEGDQHYNSANVIVDLGTLVQQVKDSMNVLQDEKRSSKEKADHARLFVYRALSIHPVLNAMRPPTKILGDLDWYTELGSPMATLSGIFKNLGRNDHFKRTSNLGEQGRRARIMLLLCWVIGHRLEKDKIRQLISTAVDDALATIQPSSNIDLLVQLNMVQTVFEQLVVMIKTRLPLPKERNPFYGEDFVASDADKVIPRAELWVYKEGVEGLSSDERYEFDVKRNPSILLRPLISRVIVPETKLSLLIIQWVTRNFGLGKKVFCRNDVDPEMIWNADPPPLSLLASLRDSSSSPSDEEEDDILMNDMTNALSSNGSVGSGIDSPQTLFEAFEDWPLEQWIHFRFCRTYQVHGWAHNRIVRVLLFNSFCHQQTLPSSSDILTAVHISKRLRVVLGDDILALVEPLILVTGMQEWTELSGETDWAPAFQTIGRDGRGRMLIFSDALSESFNLDSGMPPGPPAFHQASSFLTNPMTDCPDQSDIIEVASMELNSVGTVSTDIPHLDPSTCICGKCVPLHRHLQQNPHDFQMKYLAVVDASDDRGCCTAIEEAWDGLFTKAEDWVDTYMDRIDCPFDLFPCTGERRLGISIVDVAFASGLDVGIPLDTRQLLRFVTHLRLRHLYTDYFIDSATLPKVSQNYFALITPAQTDGDGLLNVISTAGGWLYDIAGGGMDDPNASIYFIPSSDDLCIRHISMAVPSIEGIRMPSIIFSGPITIPPDHSMLDAPEIPSRTSGYLNDDTVTIDLSQDSVHGFPPLSSRNSLDSTSISNSSYEGYGAQIHTSFRNRFICTWWRPEIAVGRPCSHIDGYGRMTCCSLTSEQVLLQIKPRRDLEPTQSHQSTSDPDVAASFFQDQQDRTAFITERGGPFEKGRMCIVRCGDEEGSANPVLLLAASLGMKAYIFHFQECWNCACLRMRAQACTLGISTGTKVVTQCAHCVVADERARRIAAILDAK